MNILLAFSPFIVFVVLHRLIGVEPGLIGAVAMSLLLLARDAVIRRQMPKVLEIGTALLFGALALYEGVTEAAWSIAGVRLAVDAGLLLVVLVSMAIGQPFTLQYARERVSQALWHEPEFVRVNVVITAVWAAAFAAMSLIDLAWLMVPTLPTRVAIIATVLALLGAVKFTDSVPGPQARRVAASNQRITEGVPVTGIIKASIAFSITNYACSCFVIGVIFALMSIARTGRTNRSLIVEKLLVWHVFWSIGACYLLNFVFHGLFGQMAANFIGWSDSPFQFEVATASLGFSVIGFLAAWGSRDFRIAAILGPAVFTLGAAAGHVHQMMTAHNFAPGNAGLIFYTDIGLPLFGFVLLRLQAHEEGVSDVSVSRTHTLRTADL